MELLFHRFVALPIIVRALIKFLTARTVEKGFSHSFASNFNSQSDRKIIYMFTVRTSQTQEMVHPS